MMMYLYERYIQIPNVSIFCLPSIMTTYEFFSVPTSILIDSFIICRDCEAVYYDIDIQPNRSSV